MNRTKTKATDVVPQPDSDSYKWSDGWPVFFTHWGPGEPTNHKGEGCVSMHAPSRFIQGTWNDTACDSIKPYICKITSGKIQKDQNFSYALPTNDTFQICLQKSLQRHLLPVTGSVCQAGGHTDDTAIMFIMAKWASRGRRHDITARR